MILCELRATFLAFTMTKQQKRPSKYEEIFTRSDYFYQFNLAKIFLFCIFALNLLLHKGKCQMRRIFKSLREVFRDENFTHIVENIEVLVAKLLSVCMLFVIGVAIFDLINFTFKELFLSEYDGFYKTLFKVFGLFLNVLIALEILENITGYLKKHVLQVELVIVTSLIAVARKIIILDLDKVEGIDIIGLGLAVLSLSISYFIIRISNSKNMH
jgi:uncharacterized membrane protein (DUF373 family)